MVTDNIPNAQIQTQANVFFEGKCISHTVITASGEKKSVGVILPSQLTFNTAAPEIMECVAGACEYKLAGDHEWQKSGPGERFHVPANSSFDIKVAQSYHYICHFG